jgi:MFS family permease
MNRNLRLLGFGVAIRMFGNAMYAPFLALFLVNALHVSYVGVGVIVAGVGLVQLPFNMLGGLVADRVERRWLILIGLAAEAAATAGLAFGFAERSLAIAIAAATVGGSIGALAAPASSAYIADFAEGTERTRGFTFYRIGFNAGYSAGVTFGGVLVSFLGFAGAVGLAAVVIAAGAGFLAVVLAPSPRDVVRRASVASRTDPPLNRAAAPSAKPPPAPTFRASLAVLARDRPALELLLATACAALVVGQWALVFPLFVHNVLGISYALLGAGLALNGLVVVFGQTATTESVVGWRHTTIAVLGMLLYVVAFLGLGASGLWPALSVGVYFVAVVVLTVGENLITIPQATLPSNLAPKAEIGSYNGAFAMVGAVGFLASVLLGGAVLSWTANPLLIWAILIVPAFPAIVLYRHARIHLAPEVDRA